MLLCISEKEGGPVENNPMREIGSAADNPMREQVPVAYNTMRERSPTADNRLSGGGLAVPSRFSAVDNPMTEEGLVEADLQQPTL